MLCHTVSESQESGSSEKSITWLGAYSHLQATLRESALKPTHVFDMLAGLSSSLAVSQRLQFLVMWSPVWVVYSMAIGFSRVCKRAEQRKRERENRSEALVFQNLITKPNYLCCMLWFPETNLGTMSEEWTAQGCEAGLPQRLPTTETPQ